MDAATSSAWMLRDLHSPKTPWGSTRLFELRHTAGRLQVCRPSYLDTPRRPFVRTSSADPRRSSNRPSYELTRLFPQACSPECVVLVRIPCPTVVAGQRVTLRVRPVPVVRVRARAGDHG